VLARGCTRSAVLWRGAARPRTRLHYYYPVRPTGRCVVETDICVYGGTSAGIAAALGRAVFAGLQVTPAG
jgi:hypothetical protein